MRDRLTENTLQGFLEATRDWRLSHAERCELILGEAGPRAQRALLEQLRRLRHGLSLDSLDTGAIERCLLAIELGLRLKRLDVDLIPRWITSASGQQARQAILEGRRSYLDAVCEHLPPARGLAYASLGCSARWLDHIISQAQSEMSQSTARLPDGVGGPQAYPEPARKVGAA